MEKSSRGTSKYPWEKWSGELKDGQAWKVTRHLDYTCESRSFAGLVYREATERGLKVTVTVFEDFVLFRFYREDDYWKPNMNAFPEVKKLIRKYR